MLRQKRSKNIPSLEELSTSDLIKMWSSTLEQRDTRQRARELKRLEGLIKAAEVQAERCDSNAHVAINHLPPEVLQEIFVTTCTVELDEYISTYYGCDDFTATWDPTWIEKGRAVTLMLVCHHWKEIALGIRELWNGIETYWDDEDHILLERSGRGPLKVLACGELEPSYAVAHALQNVEHSSRVQELYWIGLSENAEEDLRTYLGMPAPSLRSLALQGDHGHMTDGEFELFSNHTPCLECLSLSDVNWLPSNVFSQLTFLALDKCKAPIKLRSLLAGTPNLVDLILCGVTDNSYRHVGVETEPSDMKPVSLARLRRLRIGVMWSDDIDYVFRDARLNEDLSVLITHKQRNDDGQRLLEVVSSWSLNALKQPKQLHFQPHVVIVTGASSGFRFEVRGSMTLEYWATFNWPRILPLSSISHLCTFESDTCRPPRLEPVRNLLRQMTTLQTLSVDIDGLTEIVDALTSFRKLIDPPLCPTLSTLRIVIWNDSCCDTILGSILPHRAQLAIKHLYVGLVDPWSHKDWRSRQIMKDQLHGKFESVNFETLLYADEYNITLPPVCVEEVRGLWPPWLKVSRGREMAWMGCRLGC